MVEGRRRWGSEGLTGQTKKHSLDFSLKQQYLHALQYVLKTSETVVSLQQYFANLPSSSSLTRRKVH